MNMDSLVANGDVARLRKFLSKTSTDTEKWLRKAVVAGFDHTSHRPVEVVKVLLEHCGWTVRPTYWKKVATVAMSEVDVEAAVTVLQWGAPSVSNEDKFMTQLLKLSSHAGASALLPHVIRLCPDCTWTYDLALTASRQPQPSALTVGVQAAVLKRLQQVHDSATSATKAELDRVTTALSAAEGELAAKSREVAGYEATSCASANASGAFDDAVRLGMALLTVCDRSVESPLARYREAIHVVQSFDGSGPVAAEDRAAAVAAAKQVVGLPIEMTAHQSDITAAEHEQIPDPSRAVPSSPVTEVNDSSPSCWTDIDSSGEGDLDAQCASPAAAAAPAVPTSSALEGVCRESVLIGPDPALLGPLRDALNQADAHVHTAVVCDTAAARLRAHAAFIDGLPAITEAVHAAVEGVVLSFHSEESVHAAVAEAASIVDVHGPAAGPGGEAWREGIVSAAKAAVRAVLDQRHVVAEQGSKHDRVAEGLSFGVYDATELFDVEASLAAARATLAARERRAQEALQDVRRALRAFPGDAALTALFDGSRDAALGPLWQVWRQPHCSITGSYTDVEALVNNHSGVEISKARRAPADGTEESGAFVVLRRYPLEMQRTSEDIPRTMKLLRRLPPQACDPPLVLLPTRGFVDPSLKQAVLEFPFVPLRSLGDLSGFGHTELKDLSKREWLVIAFRLLTAVRLLHTHGVYHGDLTSSNVLFWSRLEPCIADVCDTVTFDRTRTVARVTAASLPPELLKDIGSSFPTRFTPEASAAVDAFQCGLLLKVLTKKLTDAPHATFVEVSAALMANDAGDRITVAAAMEKLQAFSTEPLPEELSAATAVSPLDPPSYWSVRQALPGDPAPQPPAKTWKLSSVSRDCGFFLQATQNENLTLWRSYATEREALAEAHKVDPCLPPPSAVMAGSSAPFTQHSGTDLRAITDVLAATELRAGANEVYLFHGTAEATVPQICRRGFDPSRSGEHVGQLFGQGTCFTPCLAKAIQYAARYDHVWPSEPRLCSGGRHERRRSCGGHR